MFTISSKGSFKNTEKFLQSMSKGDIFRSLDKYGPEGSVARVTGLTAERMLAFFQFQCQMLFYR